MVEGDLVHKPRLLILLRSPHDVEKGLGSNIPRSRTSLELRRCCHVGLSTRAYQGREKVLTPRGSRSGVSHPPSSRRRGAFGMIIRTSNGSCFARRKSDHVQVPGHAVDIPIDNFHFRPGRHMKGEGSSQREGGTLLHFYMFLRRPFISEKGRPHPPHREKPHRFASS